MADISTQQRPSPNRRRRGKNQVQHSVQKAYASENDVAGFESSHYGVAPQTPSKTNYTSPGPKPNQATNTKQRMKIKTARQKNAGTTTSPEPDHPSHTTPHRPASLKPAFAGATFHASPAPSALPIPSFLAKPPRDSPAATEEEPASVQQQPSPPTTDNELPTPHRPSPAAKVSESPLDFMFRAHRQEKERERHGQSPNVFNTATPPSFSSPLVPKTSSQPPTRSTPTNRASHGIDYDELNGTSGQPVGPAFSTPYQDRIRAARSGQNRSAPIQHQPLSSNEPIEDPTEALKKFLFSGHMTSPTNPSPLGGTPPAPAHSHAGFSPRPVPANNSPRAGHQTHTIQAMENDLRRILKLDNAVDSPSTERRLFTQ
ncbi:unnamed protein product [Clonostachys rosea]|uniref:Proteophosphoglycan 5 n=1 Tax=Bionectria ochroleuca TaxID=29856 RepID=A0ABY6U8C8_BIOOC|nr:unnamed protein product [Clonostachys rosea]